MATFLDLLRGFTNPPAGQPGHWQSFGESSPWNPNEQGQDIPVPAGTPIQGLPGTVTGVQTGWGPGLDAVTETTADGTFVIGHITPSVHVGEQITAGQSIGIAGNPAGGQHIEVQALGADGKPVDPYSIPVLSGVGSAVGNAASAVGTTVHDHNPLSLLSGIADLVKSVVAVVFGGFIRFLLTIVGIVLIGIGGYILFGNPSNDAGRIAKAALL